MGEINIRNFRPSDLERVAEIMALAFEGKFQSLAPMPREEMPRFLTETGAVYSSPFPGYVVAEVGGEVVGVLALKWAGQKRPPGEYPIRRAASKYGWRKVLKLFLGLWLLEYKPKPGECYIEHIAVMPGFQGMGIGTRLLEFGEEFARNNKFERLTLHVASSNERAIRLYMKRGFKTEKVTRSRITQRLFGIPEWRYMVKYLTLSM
ncbi:GNAT family N-acetyltransferase [Pyrococcus kukulkanii]|uniref:GNAT family N-acetyltransferase n=1 Tax=Pyrococcus kukulkanii TaxID=1609559 RepID=UPI00356A4E70